MTTVDGYDRARSIRRVASRKCSARTDLVAIATVRKRGGSICFGEVSVTNAAGEEVAFATVTYKLQA